MGCVVRCPACLRLVFSLAGPLLQKLFRNRSTRGRRPRSRHLFRPANQHVDSFHYFIPHYFIPHLGNVVCACANHLILAAQICESHFDVYSAKKLKYLKLCKVGNDDYSLQVQGEHFTLRKVRETRLPRGITVNPESGEGLTYPGMRLFTSSVFLAVILYCGNSHKTNQ